MTDLAFSTVHLDDLGDVEAAQAVRLLRILDLKAPANNLKTAYYEGTQRVRDLGISIPPQLRNIETVVGWPGTVVDVLEERLDLEGFSLPESDVDDYGINDIVERNRLLMASGMGNLDALIYGVAFVVAGSGMDDEPDPLVTVESPLHTTAVFDRRSWRVTAGLSRTWDAERGRTSGFALYLPDETIRAERDDSRMSGWRVVDRDDHNLGRVPMARIVNRPRSSDPFGRSEITRAVRGYTDAAVRTLLGMEVSREFFASPQRYMLGADESSFVGPDGTARTAWETYLGRFLALTRDEAGELPQVGQFEANSPAPFIEGVKMLSQMLSAESAVPSSQLGFVSDNPPSADSVRMLEARLVKRAERRQTAFGALGYAEAVRLAVLVRDGELPPALHRLEAVWRDPSTPTRAAATDGVVKLVAAGILSPQSEITWEQLGLDANTRKRLAAEAAANPGALDLLMQGLADGQTTTAVAEASDIKAKADAMGVLIRAGVDPADAAARVGLPGVRFTGAVPTSLRLPVDEATGLEGKGA